jgi:hypothetical protein
LQLARARFSLLAAAAPRDVGLGTMKSHPLLSWLATALLLIGCASSSGPPRGDTPLPDLSAVGEAAPAASGTGPGKGRGAGSGDQPLAAGWSKPGVSRAEKSADMEACYRSAWAQVDNDIRIDDDIAAARDQVGSYQSRLGDLTKRVDSHYYSRQRSTRFEGCMRSKGYRHG